MINNVTLLGTVDKEPKTNRAATATFFTVATWAYWNGKRFTTRTKVDVFGKLQQDLPSLQEGSLVLIEGKLNNSSYEKNGQKVFSTSVVAKKIELVTPHGVESAEDSDAGGAGGGDVLREDAKEPSSYPPKKESADSGDGDFPW